jgi:hypothetical protein
LDFSTANRLTVMRIACERSATSYIEGENVAIKYRWAENQRKRPASAGGRIGSPAGRVDWSDQRNALKFLH